MPLTDVAIKNAKPRDKPYKVGDTLGLFLLVQPSGGKLWRVKYRIDGKEKKLAIGIYPQVGLAEARRRRDAARELVAAGKDPGREKQREKVRSSQTPETTIMHSSRLTAMARPAKVDSRFSCALIRRCFSPSNSMIAAVMSGSRMGATISWFITLIL